MVFTSYIFVFYFLPTVLLGYYLLPRGKNVFLLAASYLFYGWWDPAYMPLMFAATAVNYACGSIIARAPLGAPRRRLALTGSVVVSLALLGFYKYFMFAEENLNRLLAIFGAPALPVLEVALPVGISFYIFQSMTYPIDLYRGDSKPARSFLDFACFVALFPQLIAGPIVRYRTIARQLEQRRHTPSKAASGVALFVFGFAKKVLLANMLGQGVDAVYAAEAPCMLDALYGAAAFGFQIYFDFSGYSDMAIGLGRMLGFEFPRNFDAPFRAVSITDFWRRWHISLSTFLRDYLYIPLGGNKRGEWRTYANIAAVMLLGGLWHGAAWNYVAWGAYHGLVLAVERRRGKRSVYANLPRPFQMALNYVVLLPTWAIFRIEDVGRLGQYLAAMAGCGAASRGALLLPSMIYSPGQLALMALCAVLAFQPFQAFDLAERVTWPKALALALLFAVSLGLMFVQAFNPFLYFQF